MLDISVKQMKYAVEIGRCGSINQAAQNLYVTQSSLSKAMKELENVQGGIEFRDLTFRYPDGEFDELEHVSFKINPGENIVVLTSHKGTPP